jgi:vacuolar-type H+-ATPase subunit F/Vma7
LKKVLFLTPKDAEHGFQLAGAGQMVPREEDTLEDVLRKGMQESDIGLIAIDERLLKEIDEKNMREMEMKWGGILVVLPAPERPGITVEDYALALVRRAIGYHVRLRP